MTFMMLVFTITFVVVQKKTITVTNEITDKQTTEVSNIIKNEVDMASVALDGYKKQFWIPDYINGEEYDINLTDQSELTIKYKDKIHVAFLSANVSGSISPNKGYHIIRKDNKQLRIGVGKLS